MKYLFAALIVLLIIFTLSLCRAAKQGDKIMRKGGDL